MSTSISYVFTSFISYSGSMSINPRGCRRRYVEREVLEPLEEVEVGEEAFTAPND